MAQMYWGFVEKYTAVKFITQQVLYSNACKFRNHPQSEPLFFPGSLFGCVMNIENK